MSDEKKHSPQHEELLKKQALEQQEVKEVLNFMRKYAKPASIVVLAACAFFLVNRLLEARQEKKQKRADAALMEADSAAAYKAIMEEYGSTPAAPLALMGLAMKKFNDGQVQEAATLYERFLDKHKKHELAEQARLNLITCKEAQGQLGDAHLLYGEFAAEHEDSHLAPVALMGQARCLEELGELAEAKQVYEDLVTFYPESSWAQMAEANLEVVASRLD